MIKKTCDFCNKIFLVHPYRGEIAHFCSYECYHGYQKKLAYQPKICPLCKKEFIPNRNTRQNKYCTKECSILARRKCRRGGEQIKWRDRKRTRIYQWKGEKVCAYCGKKFKYTSKNIHQKYCSVLCNVKSRAYNFDETFFQKINSEGKAYLLGLIFSDGSIGKDNSLNISSKDQGLIKTCQKLLKTNKPIYHYQNNFSLVLKNSNLYQALRNQGVLERKSWKEYSIPSIPKNLRWHFLRGVFDGDGSFYIDDRGKWKYLCASFSCGSRKFLQEIRDWLKRQDIQPQNIRFDRKPNDKGSWQLRITAKEAVKKFTNHLYKNANYFLNRKYKIITRFYGK